MQRYRFGLGEYKYFTYPLPHLIQQLRTQMYPYLMPIANAWFKVLNLDTVFPETHQELLQQCHENGQQKATPLILQYRKDGFNTLHQDLYGDVYFPIQLVIFLNQVNVDYQGGEFVLTQQIPRVQSKATVLQPQKGDVLIFTTRFKPEKGTRGYYRVNMKHGVSPLHQGERYTLYGNYPFSYTYSKTTKHALAWNPVLLELKKIVERITGETFNSCLLNLYHDGNYVLRRH